MTSRTFSKLALGIAATLCACGPALAATITFDGLRGDTGDAFSSYNEAGFTVSARFGDWKEAHAYGAPVPSIYVSDFHGTPFGSVEVTNGGTFSFASLDLAGDLTALGYEIAGWRGGNMVFDIAANQAAGAFVTIGNAAAWAQIDRLTIDVSGGGPGAINLDNIRVSAVPEPESLALMMAGLGVVGVLARRRSRHA